MGIVFRQSVKTTIVTFSGAILGALIFYFSTLYLPKQQLGVVRNLINQATVLSQFMLLGLHSTLYIFIHRYPAGEERRKVLISICLIGPLIITAICFIPYSLLQDYIVGKYQLQDAAYLRRFFYWMPVLTLLWSYTVMLEMFLTSQMKVAQSIFFREILLRIFNIIIIFLFAAGYINFDQFAISTILIYAVPVVCLFYLSSKIDGFGFSLNWRVFSRDEYKSMIHFAWYHILLGVSITLLGAVDSLMLAPLDRKGMTSLAVYANAVFIMSVIQIPYKSLTSATVPILTKAYQDNDRVKLVDLFDRSSVNLLIVSIAMAALVACNMHNAVAILPKGYEAITPLVFIFLVGRLADMCTGLNTEILSLSKFYKYNFYTSGFLLVMIIVLNRIMIPRWGIYGAAWGTSISLVAFNILKYIVVWKTLEVQPFSRKTLLILFAGLVTVAAGYFLPRISQPVVDTIVRSTVITVVYAGMLFWLRPSEDLRSYIASVKTNKKLF